MQSLSSLNECTRKRVGTQLASRSYQTGGAILVQEMHLSMSKLPSPQKQSNHLQYVLFSSHAFSLIRTHVGLHQTLASTNSKNKLPKNCPPCFKCSIQKKEAHNAVRPENSLSPLFQTTSALCLSGVTSRYLGTAGRDQQYVQVRFLASSRWSGRRTTISMGSTSG